MSGWMEEWMGGRVEVWKKRKLARWKMDSQKGRDGEKDEWMDGKDEWMAD